MQEGCVLLQVPSTMHSLKMKSPGLNMKPESQEKLALEPTMLSLLNNKSPLAGADRGGHVTAAKEVGGMV
jgi:hypothetical protein